MISALLYLRLTSLSNQILTRVRRLRQPKYLLGAIAGAAYIYFFLIRRFTHASAGSPFGPGTAAVMAILFLSGLAILRIAVAWLAPARAPAFRYSEAEIAFLFPAPLSRRTLIHYRLLSSQFAILFSAFLVALVSGQASISDSAAASGAITGSTVTKVAIKVIGWWILFSTFSLHLSATSLTLARLRDRGARIVRWRAAALAVILLYVGALVGAAVSSGRSPEASTFEDVNGLVAFVRANLETGLLGWLLLPFKVATGPFLATNTGEFFLSLGPALLLLVIHYLWVVRVEYAFEEGSIASAERAGASARSLAGSLDGGPVPLETRDPAYPPVPAKDRPVREPFRLAPVGRPETAFLWKNILSLQNSLATRRVALTALAIVAWIAILGERFLHSRHSGPKEALLPCGICALAAFYILLLGPQLIRQDLRNDLHNADLLKTYPLRGWQVAVGELLAPTLFLSGALWVTILVPAFLLDAQIVPWMTVSFRLVSATCLGLIAPAVCVIQLLVPNMLMILFPGWYQASRTRGGGIEMMGQRMIFVFGQLIIAILALGPALLAAALLIFASKWLIGTVAAVVLATLAVLAILGGEAAVGVWVLGDRFEKFDLSSELKP